MALKKLAIPTHESGFKVELAYLEKWNASEGEPSTPLAYLAGRADTAGLEYERNLPLYRRELATLLEERQFDFVLSPPSRRSDSEPYRQEILDRGIAAVDLTDCFSRNSARSRSTGSFDELIDDLDFEDRHGLKGARAVLIVDDYFVTGRTAAALLSVLRSFGFPQNADVTVACPLWLERPH